MDSDLEPELVGERIRTRGLRDTDFDALYQAASDPLIWEQHPANRHELAEFTGFFEQRLALGGALLVSDPRTDEVIGTSSFYDLNLEHDEVAIGWTFLVRSRWDGATNAELKRLMLDHALQHVDSVVFWVDPTNVRSQRAVLKIGGVHEGRHDDGDGPKERFRIRRGWKPGELPTEFVDLPQSLFVFPGPGRDKLVNAILRGTKTTTSSLLEEYDVAGGEQLPQAGDRSVVIDSDERPVAVIELIEVRQVPLGEIDVRFARDEGEGFESVAEWRVAHEKFWSSPELVEELGHEPDLSDHALVVAERFRVIWQGGTQP